LKLNKDKLARIISTIFIPPAFTLAVFIVIAFQLESDELIKIITILNALLFGVIAPITLFFKLRRSGNLVDQDASIKEERTIPYMIAVLFYSIGLAVLITFNVSIITVAFWFCYISNTILTIIINSKWKISVHAMGASGPLAAITYVFGPIALLFAILVVLVCWSRIQLECHRFSEVAGGVILAFLSTYLQIYLIVKIF
jgi:membrane-associated phospholipid phosphatase